MTLSPVELGPADAAGVGRAELIDAAVVAFTFNIYDRCADALGWKADYTADEYRRLVKGGIERFGYMFPGWNMKIEATGRAPLVEGLPADVGAYLDMLARDVLDGPARLDVSTRRGIFERTALPPFLEKVWDHAWRTTDEDVAALRASGWSEDQIFEGVVCAAVGAATVRLRAAMRVLPS